MTSRIAARTASAGPSCSGPYGKSPLTSARLTPRRTAWQTVTIWSSVTSNGVVWPQRFIPTVSPTETISTPTRSTIRAIW